jgi:hypothetical protein
MMMIGTAVQQRTQRKKGNKFAKVTSLDLVNYFLIRSELNQKLFSSFFAAFVSTMLDSGRFGAKHEPDMTVRVTN